MELRSSEKTKPKFVRTDFKVQMNSSVLDHVVAIFTRFFFFFFFFFSIMINLPLKGLSQLGHIRSLSPIETNLHTTRSGIFALPPVQKLPKISQQTASVKNVCK